jgi:hypothetical protein
MEGLCLGYIQQNCGLVHHHLLCHRCIKQLGYLWPFSLQCDMGHGLEREAHVLVVSFCRYGGFITGGWVAWSAGTIAVSGRIAPTAAHLSRTALVTQECGGRHC